jgi:DNA-binding CsgD family transcriptional regulator
MHARGRPKHPDILTPREWEVLELLRLGRTNDEIAASLGISVAGVKYHVSEILGKLHVSDRKEAANWNPENRSGPTRAIAGVPLMRRLRFDVLFTVAGVSTVGVALLAIGLLTWGVIAASRDGESENGGWSYGGEASEHTSVMLFDLANRRGTQIPVADDTVYARWVKQGETFIAQGQSGRADDYTIFGLDGQRMRTPPLQDFLTSDVVPAPDGSALLVGRTDNQYLVSDIPTGLGSTLLDRARNLAFSPDGRRMAYVTVGGSDKDNVNHDWRSIIIAEKSELTGYAGGGIAIQSQREADGLMDLVRQPWSPDVQPWSADGNYLLVVRYDSCFLGPAPNCYGLPSYEVYGTQLTGKTFWSAYPRQLQSAIWAGPHRLFVTFFPDGEYDPDYPDAQSLFADFGTLKQPAPAVLQGACCVSFSPDGRYAVVRRLDEATGRQRCSLVDSSTGDEIAGFDAGDGDIYIFCGSVSWTSDGAQALVSSANGN